MAEEAFLSQGSADVGAPSLALNTASVFHASRTRRAVLRSDVSVAYATEKYLSARLGRSALGLVKPIGAVAPPCCDASSPRQTKPIQWRGATSWQGQPGRCRPMAESALLIEYVLTGSSVLLRRGRDTSAVP